MSSCLTSITEALPHIGIPEDKISDVLNMLSGITKILDDTTRNQSKQSTIDSFFQPALPKASAVNEYIGTDFSMEASSENGK